MHSIRVLVLCLCPLALMWLPWLAHAADMPARPNILWLTSEDHGIEMGCYGDKFATTANVDKLAARGMIYTHVWSCAPVCAPSRTTLISGLYATCTGGEHMRSLVPYPAGKQMYPQLLSAAGYYCSNNSKEDYNLAKPGKVWDDSWKKASPLAATMKTMPTNGPSPHARFKSYVPRLVGDLQDRFK